MIRQVRTHGRSDAKRFVNAAEIIVCEVNTVRGPQVVPLLAEGVRQPREAAHGHADRRVLPFNWPVQIFAGSGLPMTGTFSACVTSAGLYRSLALLVLRVHLHELREIAAVAKDIRYCGYIGLTTFCADLEALRCGRVAKTFDECIRRGLRATAKSEVQKELGMAIDGDEAVSVPDGIFVRLLG